MIRWQYSAIQSAGDFLDPAVVKMVEYPGVHASPIMNRHR
jgi:hypothetical protein